MAKVDICSASRRIFIVRADGSPSLIHSGSTVSGFEFAHKTFQFYTYYGGIYIGRDTALDANGATKIGYGYAGSANSNNKTTQEGTFGIQQTFWRDARYGALQMMFQYAYFFRDPWYVATGAPKNTHEDTVWFNLRYVLPGTAPPPLSTNAVVDAGRNRSPPRFFGSAWRPTRKLTKCRA